MRASASGPTAPLRWARYAGGGGDRLPDDPASWEKAAGDLEQLLLTEPAVRGFVDLALDLGLDAYWRQYGLPDACKGRFASNPLCR